MLGAGMEDLNNQLVKLKDICDLPFFYRMKRQLFGGATIAQTCEAILHHDFVAEPRNGIISTCS